MKKLEQGSAGILFVIVLVLFTLAEKDSKKLDQLYSKSTAEKTTFPTKEAKTSSGKISQEPLINIGYKRTAL